MASCATSLEAWELVPRSQGRHYGGGKLRLWSDLDVQAIELLAAIASGDSSSREVVLQEGTVDSLVRVLDPSSRGPRRHRWRPSTRSASRRQIRR
ncbi:hypothetical protein ACQ4PT_056477 [Festuca glaucescens]